ncbi:MAG TPA: hypothetical protein VFL14_08740 [Xanthomonadales bacterium]|nr:hypothetical protein [Xanthomonadales bacterium]
MLRHRLLWLVVGCVPAAFAQAGNNGLPLAARNHLDATPQIELRWLDGELRVDADCSGCLEDVRFLEWTAGDAVAARKAVRAAVAFDPGARDALGAKLALDAGRAVGIDVVVAWRDADGNRRETTRTFFARIDERGALTPIAWDAFAVERGFAQYRQGPDGGTVLELADSGTEEARAEVQK